MRQPDIHQTLPNSIAAEQGVIGSMMLSPDAIAECVEAIDEEHFYIPACQTIYAVIVELWRKKQPFDLIVFTEHLRQRKLLDSVGGASFVTGLFTFVPTAALVEHYLGIVIQHYKARQIIATGTELVRRAYEEQDDMEGLYGLAQVKLLEMANYAGGKSRMVTMRENARRAFERVEDIMSGAVKPGLETGLLGLDRKLGGLHNGEIIAITGDTGGGKTSMAHNIARHVASHLGKTVQIFSYELPALTVTNRLIADMGSINTEHIRFATMTEVEVAAFTKAHDRLAECNLFIDDDANTSLAQLQAKARKLKSTHDTALIVVDYIQKMPADHGKRERSKQQEIAANSDGVQKLAMELNIPIIVLAQWNQKDGSIREAKDIIFDAKTLLKIVRDETKEIEDEGETAFRDIIIAKNNNGAIGKVSATFHKKWVRFEAK